MESREISWKEVWLDGASFLIRLLALVLFFFATDLIILKLLSSIMPLKSMSIFFSIPLFLTYLIISMLLGIAVGCWVAGTFNLGILFLFIVAPAFLIRSNFREFYISYFLFMSIIWFLRLIYDLLVPSKRSLRGSKNYFWPGPLKKFLNRLRFEV